MSEPKWITLGHPSYVWRFGQDRRLALIDDWAPLTGCRILDVGCGIGTYVRAFRQFSPRVFGVDVDEERVVQGAQELPNLEVAASENLPFQNDWFDVVLMNEVIEHVDDDGKTVTEALRVLRPGGRLVIFAPNRLYLFETHGIYWGHRYIFRLIPFVNWLPDPLRRIFCPHVRAYTARGIRALFRGMQAKIMHHGYVYPGFDNIMARHKRSGRVLRRLFYFFETTPLAVFGLSHFVVIEKT